VVDLQSYAVIARCHADLSPTGGADGSGCGDASAFCASGLIVVGTGIVRAGRCRAPSASIVASCAAASAACAGVAAFSACAPRTLQGPVRPASAIVATMTGARLQSMGTFIWLRLLFECLSEAQ